MALCMDGLLFSGSKLRSPKAYRSPDPVTVIYEHLPGLLTGFSEQDEGVCHGKSLLRWPQGAMRSTDRQLKFELPAV